MNEKKYNTDHGLIRKNVIIITKNVIFLMKNVIFIKNPTRLKNELGYVKLSRSKNCNFILLLFGICRIRAITPST